MKTLAPAGMADPMETLIQLVPARIELAEAGLAETGLTMISYVQTGLTQTGLGRARITDPLAAVVVVGLGAALLATSGLVVRTVINAVEDRSEPSQRERDVGAIVGKTENVLVYAFVLVDAFTALAIIFAAKSIVRREDMKNDSLFYLAGTLVNFTYSLLVGLLAVGLLRFL